MKLTHRALSIDGTLRVHCSFNGHYLNLVYNFKHRNLENLKRNQVTSLEPWRSMIR